MHMSIGHMFFWGYHHELPVAARIRFKILFLVYDGANEKAPTVIYKPCTNHTPQLGNSNQLNLVRAAFSFLHMKDY